ncbi:MAG: hypothetical protein LBH90_07130 [Tannerella sp.]|jgi:3-hydroxyacyl-[acyl-carrier-protein] dehydratase|nr:hypothetical protein [Tannerella sp.]
MLLNYYYSIKSRETDGEITRFNIMLHEDCDIYKGHFPGAPVAPGVCNIQMIKECAEQLTGKQLLLTYIPQCKFSTLITPRQYPDLQVRIRILEQNDAQIKINAGIGPENMDFLTLKGDYSFIN